MPSVKDLFPSKYLSAKDLDDEDLIVTIKRVEEEEVGQGDKKEDKYVLYFKGVEKGMVLNKTNANTLAALLGDETDDWIGKQATLCVMDVEFGGKLTPGLRFKSRLPKPKADKVAKPAARDPGGDDEESDGPPF
jgi:hypothetical protein